MNKVSEDIVVKIALDAARNAIEWASILHWLEDDVVLRPAHICAWLQFMDRVVGESVGTCHVGQRAQRTDELAFSSGRKLAQLIAEHGVHVRLIEGDPVGTKISEDSPRLCG